MIGKTRRRGASLANSNKSNGSYGLTNSFLFQIELYFQKKGKSTKKNEACQVPQKTQACQVPKNANQFPDSIALGEVSSGTLLVHVLWNLKMFELLGSNFHLVLFMVMRVR